MASSERNVMVSLPPVVIKGDGIKQMIDEGKPCLKIVQQLHAVEKAISAAKRALIHDHLDHCLEDAVRAQPRGSRAAVAEFKDITKYL